MKEQMSELAKWIELMKDACCILGDARAMRISCDSGSVDVQITIEDFRRLFAGKVAQRQEYRGDWHWRYVQDGIKFIAVEHNGAYETPVIEDAVVEDVQPQPA